MLKAVPWLPAEQPGKFARILDDLVRDWRAEWFSNPPSLSVESGNSRSRSQKWGSPSAVVAASDEDVVQLGNNIIDRQGQISHSADCKIMTSVGMASLRSLATRICDAAFGSETLSEEHAVELAPGPHRYWRVVSDGGWEIDCILNEEATVRLRKYRSGSRTMPEPTKVMSALHCEEVELGCHLGGASLSAGDLRQLGAGDVIALDRRTDEALS